MSLTPDEWARTRRSFEEAVDLSPEDRSSHLSRLHDADPILWSRVTDLLASHHRADGFLETPATLVFAPDSLRGSLEGRSLGRYEIAGRLGSGGMGDVFQARDSRLERVVAIKVLPARCSTGLEADRQFDHEARAIAALNHPNICTLHDIGEMPSPMAPAKEKIRYLVMEYVHGVTLDTVSPLPLAPVRLADIAAQVSDALDAAHARGIVHRDIKPQNLMVRPDGQVKVLDFGIALLIREVTTSGDEEVTIRTHDDRVVGTPAYMSPEQRSGGVVGTASDIFSLGLVLYKLATGRHPFVGGRGAVSLQDLLDRTPVRPREVNAAVPPEIDRVIMQMLAGDPTRRPNAATVKRIMRDPTALSPRPLTGRGPASARAGLVGRDAERAEARQLLGRAAAGDGSVLLIAGEPGIGKTRMAEEVLASASAAGCTTLVGRCYEVEGSLPFSPWIEIVEECARTLPATTLRELLGEHAAEIVGLVPALRGRFTDVGAPLELPPAQRQHYLLNCFLDWFERLARKASLVVLLDDLQWADDSSLRLLAHLARHVPRMPMLIVGTLRDVDVESRRPFADAIDTLTRGRLAHHMALHRLHDTAVRDLLEQLGSAAVPDVLVQMLQREAEGNPFFIEEIFYHLSEEGKLFDRDGRWRRDLEGLTLDLPSSIRLVIGRRLAHLSEQARRVLIMAAIIGRSFDLTLLRMIGGFNEDGLLACLEEAEASKLLSSRAVGGDVRWIFAHGLIRQTLESSLSLTRRQQAHLRVSQALEQLYGDDVGLHAADVAAHLCQAGGLAAPDKVASYSLLAGDQALRAGAFEEALQHFDRALTMHDECDRQGLAALRHKRGHALRSLGRGEAALEDWRVALAICRELGDDEGVAQTLYDAVWETSWSAPGSPWLDGRSPLEAARVLAEQGLAQAGPENSVARGRLLALLSLWSARAGDRYQTAFALLDQADAIGSRVSHPSVAIELVEARAHVSFAYGLLPAAVHAGERAIATRLERREQYDACDDIWMVMLSRFCLGQFDAAGAMARTLESAATKVGHLPGQWNARAVATLLHLAAGADLTESAARAARDLDEAGRTNPAWRGINHLILGFAHFYGGQWAQARAELDHAATLDIASFLTGLLTSSAWVIRAYDGDRDLLGVVRASAADLLQRSSRNPAGVWDRLLNVVECLAQLGQTTEAGALYPLVREGLEHGLVLSYTLRLWQTMAGVSAGAAGHWEAAHDHFARALDQASSAQNRIAQAEVRRWYGQILMSHPEASGRERARPQLADALARYHALGMPRHVDVTGALLAAASR